MATSKHWSDPEEDVYTDDDGNVIYFDRQGKLRRFKVDDREYQQQYHYEDD